jgi:hypothetical protein
MNRILQPKHLPAALAAIALGFTMSSHASGGEALDIEMPSMRTPVEATPVAAVDANDARAVATPQAPLTRAEVRESLKMARLSNTMTPSGEIGDTTEVLRAREDFYALQTEVLQAEYAAAAQREWALQQALQASMDGAAVAAAEERPEADEYVGRPPRGYEQSGRATFAHEQVVVAPEMTVGELMSFLQDSSAEGTLVVVLPNEDETEAD